MKKRRDYITYLDDIFDAAAKGISFVKNMTYDEFQKDVKTQYALIRAIEVIGEASKKIPNEVRDQSKEIPLAGN